MLQQKILVTMHFYLQQTPHRGVNIHFLALSVYVTNARSCHIPTQLKYLRQLEVRLQNTTLDWVLSSTTELLLPPTVMPAGSQQQTAQILDEPGGKCPM